MRTGLIVFGVIFLVLGGVFYFIPTPTASAITTTASPGSTGTTVSSASLSIPWGLTLGMLVIGFVLTVFGFALTSVNDAPQRATSRTSYDVKTREDTLTDDGRKRHITHERTVRHE